GGQKADRGTIAGRPVTHVAKAGDEVNHYLESTDGFVVGQAVRVEVDGDWRRTGSAWHTAGHLIAAVVERRWPELRATNGHHWPGEARVEFDPASADLAGAVSRELPELVARAIESDLPVTVVGDPFANRAVAIGDFPPVPCGGTHARSTAGLPRVEVTKVRPKDGKLRVSYTLRG
ncbi:MAG: alanyl-tRNA editing protein, partial [Gemmata sp.]